MVRPYCALYVRRVRCAVAVPARPDDVAPRAPRVRPRHVHVCRRCIFAMHALGLWSFDAMQSGTHIHDAMWHSAAGTWTLYGAFAIHFSLGLYALYARRSFRMGTSELAAPDPRLLDRSAARAPLRVRTLRVVRVRRRTAATTCCCPRTSRSCPSGDGCRSPRCSSPGRTAASASTCGCASARGIRALAPMLLVVAVLWPTIALLGLFEGTREVLARTPASSSYGGDYGYGSYDDGYGSSTTDVAAKSRRSKREIHWAYVLLVAGVLAARGVRWARRAAARHRAHHLSGRTRGERARGLSRARGEPQRAHPARVDLRRPRPLHDLPRARAARRRVAASPSGIQSASRSRACAPGRTCASRASCARTPTSRCCRSCRRT